MADWTGVDENLAFDLVVIGTGQAGPAMARGSASQHPEMPGVSRVAARIGAWFLFRWA